MMVSKKPKLVAKWIKLLEPILLHCLTYVREYKSAEVALASLYLLQVVYQIQMTGRIKLPDQVTSQTWSVLKQLMVRLANSREEWFVDGMDQQQSTERPKKRDRSAVDNELMTSQGDVEKHVTLTLQRLVEAVLKDGKKELLDQALLNMPSGSVEEILGWLYLWHTVIRCTGEKDQDYILGSYTQSLLLSLQTVAMNGFSQVVRRVLDLETAIMLHPKLRVQSQHVNLCLHGLVDLSLTSSPALVTSACHLLESIFLTHSSTVLAVIPSVVDIVQKLVRAVMALGEQNSVHCQNKSALTCAQQVQRILERFASLKDDVCRVAPFVIANYVTESQKVTLQPAVKNALLLGIYEVLSVCDIHGIRLLKTTLPDSSQEVFSSVYDTYTKFHKYTGAV
jgi:hypothetical protein